MGSLRAVVNPGAQDLSIVEAATNSFEALNKNLRSYNYTLNYTGDSLTSVVYDLGAGDLITKTLNYTGDNLTSIVLSGDLPAWVTDTTKTLAYTGDNLTSVTYS